MTIAEIISYANSIIGDSSTDRITAAERYEAATEAVAWLLEELGNEHMVDRVDIDYVPSVMWYKLDTITPYLMGTGEVKLKEPKQSVDFTKIDSREITSAPKNRYAYAIDRFNGNSFLGILLPSTEDGEVTSLVPFNEEDGLTYTGTNGSNITETPDAVRFDMTGTGVTATGLETTTTAIDLSQKGDDDIYIVDVFIPDITDVTSVTLRFGTDLTSNYRMGTVAQDINGEALIEGNNTLLFRHRDLTVVGSPTMTSITRWRVLINHQSSKPITTGFEISDLRTAKVIPLTFKYLFYRVGQSSAGADIIQFTADTDVPFFSERYPQYRYAVGHKTASVLFRFLQLWEEVRQESREAQAALDRYRKNFPSERDSTNSAFKPAGVNLRRNRIIRRR